MSLHTNMDFRPTRARPTKKKGSAAGFLPAIIAILAVVGLFLYHSDLETKLHDAKVETGIHANSGLQYEGVTREYQAYLAREDRLLQALALSRDFERRTSFAQEVHEFNNFLPRNQNEIAFLKTLQITETPGYPQLDNAAPYTGKEQVLTLNVSGAASTTEAISNLTRQFEAHPDYDANLESLSRVNANEYAFQMRLHKLNRPEPQITVNTPDETTSVTASPADAALPLGGSNQGVSGEILPLLPSGGAQ